MYTNALSDEAKSFLSDQAEILKTGEVPCTLITYGPHTSYNGKVIDVAEGGLIFLETDTGRQVMTPWENVEKFVTIPVLTQAVEPTRVASRAAGNK